MKYLLAICALFVAQVPGATPAAAQPLVAVREGNCLIFYHRQPDGSLKPHPNGLRQCDPAIAAPEERVRYADTFVKVPGGVMGGSISRAFDAMTRSWCYFMNPGWNSAVLVCTPELQIPAASLRMFRQQAGMSREDVLGPRYNYISGKMEPLPDE
jgi:hypothetical protein